MARRNRLVVADACYHLTARIANRELLLRSPALRDRIAGWIYGIADFAGVEVDAWCVMENHLHLVVRVPSVPARYWTPAVPTSTGTVPGGSVPDSPAPAGTVPAGAAPADDPSLAPPTAAFSMRPRECRAPRWTPDLVGARPAITPAGDLPSDEAVRRAVADGVPLALLPRPATGFALPDGEMAACLARLYADRPGRAAAVRRRWERWRRAGRGGDVAREQDALCRRMYNVTQYMKALKQRISETVNRETGHAGTLWDGRFRSAVVGDAEGDFLTVAAYVAWNPVKPGLARTPAGWRWSSYAAACDPSSPWHAAARAGYERRLGRSWGEVRAQLEAAFAEKLPPEYDPEADPVGYRAAGADGRSERRLLTAGQLVKTKVAMFERGGYVARDRAFVRRILRGVPKLFAKPSEASVAFFGLFPWRVAGSPAVA